MGFPRRIAIAAAEGRGYGTDDVGPIKRSPVTPLRARPLNYVSLRSSLPDMAAFMERIAKSGVKVCRNSPAADTRRRIRRARRRAYFLVQPVGLAPRIHAGLVGLRKEARANETVG